MLGCPLPRFVSGQSCSARVEGGSHALGYHPFASLRPMFTPSSPRRGGLSLEGCFWRGVPLSLHGAGGQRVGRSLNRLPWPGSLSSGRMGPSSSIILPTASPWTLWGCCLPELALATASLPWLVSR